MTLATLFQKSITDEKDYLEIVADDLTIVSADDASPDSDSSFPQDTEAPFGFAGNKVISHLAGGVPMVRAFWDPFHRDEWYSCRVPDPDNFGIRTEPWLKVIVTSTELKLMMNTDDVNQAYYVPVFWRLYKVGPQSVTTNSRIDKIVEKGTNSASVSAAASSIDPNYTRVILPHSVGEAPIFAMEFAESANGPWYPEGTQIIGPFDTSSGPPGGPYARYYYTSAYMYTDATSVYIVRENNYASSKTIYVRYALDKMQ